MDLKKTSHNRAVRWMFVKRLCVVRLVLKQNKNSADKIIPGRLKEQFDAVNFSKKNLHKADNSLLSKGVKFVLTLNNMNKAKSQEDLKYLDLKFFLIDISNMTIGFLDF